MKHERAREIVDGNKQKADGKVIFDDGRVAPRSRRDRKTASNKHSVELDILQSRADEKT